MIIEKDMSPQEIVFSIGLFNRYCSSLRCREAATELVMLLDPLCLLARRLCAARGYKKRNVTTGDSFLYWFVQSLLQ